MLENYFPILMFILVGIALGVVPVAPVLPSALRIERVAVRTSNPVTEALPVFAAYANLPLFVRTHLV